MILQGLPFNHFIKGPWKQLIVLYIFFSIFDKFLNNLFRSDTFLWNLSVTFLRVTRYLELRFDLNSIQFSSDKKSLWILIKVFIKCFLSVFLSLYISVFLYFCILSFWLSVPLSFCILVFLTSFLPVGFVCLSFSLLFFVLVCWSI